ncbi:unnamed protein product [Rhizophagus irregularis]|nr:unnamed protein product [Rhizophagus irregularis]
MSLSRPARTAIVSKGEIECKECKKRKVKDENHETCQLCYEIFKPNLKFVPYDQFKNIEFIAEGGFSKIYKAIWVDGPINTFHSIDNIVREKNYTVVLKKLNNSKSITSKELNEFKVYYQILSKDIGPVTINNPDAIYKSRPLSRMIQSAMSLRSSRSQSIDPFYYYQKNTDKRKFEDDSVEDSNDNEQSIKRRKFLENENSDYFTKDIELDINMSSDQPRDKGYVTKEIDLDINAL